MVEVRGGGQSQNYLHWGEETANVVTITTTILDEGTVRGVISVASVGCVLAHTTLKTTPTAQIAA